MTTFVCHGCKEHCDFSEKRYVLREYIGSRFVNSHTFCADCYRIRRGMGLKRVSA